MVRKSGNIFSLLLVLLMVFGSMPATAYGQPKDDNFNKDNPFEMMVDTTPELMSVEEIIESATLSDTSQAAIETAIVELEPSDYEDVEEVQKIIEDTVEDINDEGVDTELDPLLLEYFLEQQQELVEQSKTDRYIVKYKDDDKDSFKEKVGDKIRQSIELTDIRQNNKRFFKTNGPDRAPDSFYEISLDTIDLLNWNDDKKELIIVEDSVNPSEFADTLRERDVENEIEYIQPDFQFELNSLDDSISDDESIDDQDPVEQESTEEMTDEQIDDSEGDVSEDSSSEESQEIDSSEETSIVDSLDESTLDETPADRDISNEPVEEPVIDESITDEAITTEEAINNELLPEEFQKNKVLVAILDTGIDITHPDLADYVYINSGEIPDNGIDDDGNGYIDDIKGWNFTENSGVVYDEKLGLKQAHGTHIAGIIAGLSNADDNLTPNDVVEILPLKVFSNGTAYTSDIITAINYAEKMGAKIVNCSFGSTDNNPALKEAMKSSDMLFTCSVGNARSDLEETPVYPACFEMNNILSVTSTNDDGGLSYFSNYSKNLVDVAAKGRDINSTLPGGKHGLQNGTSMSTAIVSRVAAEVLGTDNGLDFVELKQRLINTSDRLSNLQEEVVEGRQINISNAINNLEQINIVQNSPENDFDVLGYHPTQEELYSLFSSGNVTQASAGYLNSLMLMSDGTVFEYSMFMKGILTQVIGLENIVSVESCFNHNLALKSDGTVWTWDIGYGVSVPVQVNGLTDVRSIAGNYDFDLALKSDGTVVQVNGLTDVYCISSGWDYKLAVSGGTVWKLKLSNNAMEASQVSGLNDIVSASAGWHHCLALDDRKGVWAWGSNEYGELGDGTTTSQSTPVQVEYLDGICYISAGRNYSLALDYGGIVWFWGNGEYFKSYDWLIAQEVSGLDDVSHISAGYDYSLAVKSDGTIWGWGRNRFGQLGPLDVSQYTVPTQCNTNPGVFRFDNTNYIAEIPGSGVNTITVQATGTDSYGNTLSTSDFSYSLAETYTGVSINSNTGEITIEPSAKEGSVQVIATYKKMTCSAVLKIINLCKISTIAGSIYDIPLIVNNNSSFSGKTFTLTYDSSDLEPIDLCAFTDAKETGTGDIPGAGITITNVSAGTIVMTVDKTVPAGKQWSGVINVIKFKALITGETTVTAEYN